MFKLDLPITQELLDYLATFQDQIVPGATISVNSDGKPTDPTQPPLGPGH